MQAARRLGLPLLALMASLPAASATCATFAAWLAPEHVVGMQVSNNLLAGGFVSFIVSSDLRSIDVNWQIRGGMGAGDRTSYITHAGVFGPAEAGQNKPSMMGTLLDLDLGVLGGNAPAYDVTIKRRIRASAADMNQLLTFMRENRAYVSVMTSNNQEGELRGQIVAPHCLETALTSSVAGSQYHGFANVLISPNMTENAWAALVQMSPKASGTATITAGADTTSAFTVNDEFNPTMPNEGQMYMFARMDAAWSTHFRNVYSGEMMATVATSMQSLSGSLMMAKSCRKLMTAEDTLFTIARAHQNDWITVWSMNDGQPDNRRTLEPKYYAHPMELKTGETAERIQNRFGMTMEELQRANPSISDFGSMSEGSECPSC